VDRRSEVSTEVTEARWKGVSVRLFRQHWTAAARFQALVAERPTLHIILDEVGGRCELRASAEHAPIDYHGMNALAFAPSGSSLYIHHQHMREVQIASFAFHTDEIDQFSPSFASAIDQAPAKLMFNDESLRDCATMLATECEKRENPPEYGVGLALSLVAAAASACTSSPPLRGRRLSQRQFGLASEYMERRLDQAIALPDLAAVVGLAPEKFAIAFRHSTGMSPQQWHMRARVHRAQEMMLDDPARSFTEIASRLRFADQSHFSRVFKQFTGATPREWLRRRS
jgi:AraC-like DNA-binding protein